MRDLTRLPNKLDAKGATCRAVIETPKGAPAKFDYDAKTGLFRLHRMLPAGFAFPCNFGFVPATRAEDGDPLDIMLLGAPALAPGTLVEARLLGAIEAEQSEAGRKKPIRNDRLVAVPAVAETEQMRRSLNDLGNPLLQELCQFWTDKDKAEGKRFRVLRLAGPEAAVRLVRKSARTA